MSNELCNAHIAFGSPCGEDADFMEIADWAGCILLGSYDLEPTNSYLHIKTGNLYQVMDPGHKMKINGKWEEGVLYKNEKGETFSRIRDDFNQNFDWANK